MSPMLTESLTQACSYQSPQYLSLCDRIRLRHVWQYHGLPLHRSSRRSPECSKRPLNELMQAIRRCEADLHLKISWGTTWNTGFSIPLGPARDKPRCPAHEHNGLAHTYDAQLPCQFMFVHSLVHST